MTDPTWTHFDDRPAHRQLEQPDQARTLVHVSAVGAAPVSEAGSPFPPSADDRYRLAMDWLTPATATALAAAIAAFAALITVIVKGRIDYRLAVPGQDVGSGRGCLSG